MTAREGFEVPHSIEAEQAVIGALLIDNDAVDRLEGLTSAFFYRADHRVILDEIFALLTSGGGADSLTVWERLAAKGMADDVGGLPYLTALALQTPSSANIGRYAAIVRDRAVKRKLLGIASDIEQMAFGADEARVLVDKAQAKLEEIAQQRVNSEPVRASASMSQYLEHLTDLLDGKKKPVSTGLRDLDDRLSGGLRPSEFVVVAGRPAMGKTAFAMQIANAVAVDRSVLVLSLEMSIEQLHERNVSYFGGIEGRKLRDVSQMEQEDWERVTHATMKINELNLFLDAQPAMSLMDIRTKARTVKRKHGLDLIIVDYIGLMSGGQGDNRTQEVGTYSRGLKSLAKELNVPVVALAQLSREVEKRANKRPQASDLRDSGEIEQDADIIMFLYRDEVYDPDSMQKGVCEVIVNKQRMGEPGTVPVSYSGRTYKFGDLAPGYRIPEPQSQRRGFRGDM